ncbi:hypothetical protein [Mycobacterium aquaticum]|uniref:Uncharacterized protein n=1 Tax=Mycobacterium aquaticum TaxID=1927124 RepID=A0A1X0A530_9MYCO|nr:hypothetical protein [Mycobacterium aquaticum]ORA25193.1 hypothetical protein BST13_33270 [Mycobacterium aquaticum]
MSDVVERAKAALEGVTEGPWGNYGNAPFEVFQEPEVGQEYIAPRVYALADAQFISRARSLVPELVAEVELLRSTQGLSVQIPEYGEWGSETLAYLFLDFGIQPGDGYEAASARQVDLLRELAAANAEVERLRAGYAAAIHDLHFWAGCIHSNESIQDSMHSAARAHETRLEGDQ